MTFRNVFGCLVFIAIGLLGLSSFTSCRQNGGDLFSCGLMAFVVGTFKAVLLFAAWVLVALFNGVAHLFSGG